MPVRPARHALTPPVGREVVADGLVAVKAYGVDDLRRGAAPPHDRREVGVVDDPCGEEEVDPRLTAAKPCRQVTAACSPADRSLPPDRPATARFALEVDRLEREFLHSLADVCRATTALRVLLFAVQGVLRRAHHLRFEQEPDLASGRVDAVEIVHLNEQPRDAGPRVQVLDPGASSSRSASRSLKKSPLPF